MVSLALTMMSRTRTWNYFDNWEVMDNSQIVNTCSNLLLVVALSLLIILFIYSLYSLKKSMGYTVLCLSTAVLVIVSLIIKILHLDDFSWKGFLCEIPDLLVGAYALFCIAVACCLKKRLSDDQGFIISLMIHFVITVTTNCNFLFYGGDLAMSPPKVFYLTLVWSMINFVLFRPDLLLCCMSAERVYSESFSPESMSPESVTSEIISSKSDTSETMSLQSSTSQRVPIYRATLKLSDEDSRPARASLAASAMKIAFASAFTLLLCAGRLIEIITSFGNTMEPEHYFEHADWFLYRINVIKAFLCKYRINLLDPVAQEHVQDISWLWLKTAFPENSWWILYIITYLFFMIVLLLSLRMLETQKKTTIVQFSRYDTVRLLAGRTLLVTQLLGTFYEINLFYSGGIGTMAGFNSCQLIHIIVYISMLLIVPA